MSSSALKLLAASGAKGDPVYVDDVFSTFLYEGTGAAQGIQNGINLGDFGVGTSTKFDRNVDFLSRSSDFTSNSDSKTFTFSCWVFATPAFDSNQRTLYATDSSDNGILIAIQADNTLSIEAWNGGARTFQAATNKKCGTNAWTHILISVDMANSSNRQVYFNDVEDPTSWYSYNNQNIEFTRSTHYVGIWGNGTTRGLHDDSLAHMYLDYTYRNLNTESNRRIFIDANGGSTSASSLTALNPIMYLPMTTAYAVGKNAGTGGDFTANGSPTIVENGTEYVAGNGEGGLAWFKCRNVGMLHNLFDTVRGNTQRLDSSGTSGQSAQAAGKYPTFTSTGFTLGADTGGDINYSGRDYVSWTFRKAPGFFDVVTWTGDAQAGRQVAHSLGSTPGMVIIKKLSGSEDWLCRHRSLNANQYIFLNEDNTWGNGVGTSGSGGVGNAVFDMDATNLTFNVPWSNYTNGSGHTFVAYLFAHDAQDFGIDSDEAIVKCGSYTGNGSSTAGPTIDLGFEPQFIFQKAVDRTANWYMYDSMRGIVTGGNDTALSPNTSSAEYVAERLALTASGFQITTNNGNFNQSGEKYIYMAIRRPHKPAEEFAAADLFAVDNNTTSTSAGFPNFVSGFPVDMGLANTVDETGYTSLSSRLTGKQMYTPAADAEEGSPEYDYSTGFKEGGSSTNADEYGWMWRRAPGYFDVVAYTGNQTARQIPHNLGVVPEMMWVKCRSQTRNWAVYLASQGNTKVANLNSTSAFTADTASWNNTSPTSTHFTVGDGATTNFNPESMIAYLFATVDGISKVGSYTGTGNDLNVDCGFSAGARLILIKRTDATGDWYLWDSSRGIVAGNDPYLLLNSTAAQVTNTDYVDPLASGFTVTSSAPAALNNSGGTYIFYAIA